LDYKQEIETQLSRLLGFVGEINHFLLQKKRAGDRVLFIVAGDKGIVGALYHNLINRLLEEKSRYQKIWVLGERAKEYLNEEGIRAEQFFYETPDLPSAGQIKKISAEIFFRFQTKSFRSVDILYPKFVSLAEQEPVLVRFLPFDLERKTQIFKPESQKEIESEGWPIFEPSKKRIFDSLLRRYIDVCFTEIVLEAKLSEFSARIVEAEHAASKTKDIIQALRVAFLKERRKTMTQRQLESFIAHKTLL
jgi:F-type H+-transporting ATPase subunit gamma